MLIADRVCVRCSVSEGRRVITRWTNEHDEGLDVACPVCGLTAGSPLTDDEAELVAKLDRAPVRKLRRAYVTL